MLFRNFGGKFLTAKFVCILIVFSICFENIEPNVLIFKINFLFQLGIISLQQTVTFLLENRWVWRLSLSWFPSVNVSAMNSCRICLNSFNSCLFLSYCCSIVLIPFFSRCLRFTCTFSCYLCLSCCYFPRFLWYYFYFYSLIYFFYIFWSKLLSNLSAS